jgi:hypothetical protein
MLSKRSSRATPSPMSAPSLLPSLPPSPVPQTQSGKAHTQNSPPLPPSLPLQAQSAKLDPAKIRADSAALKAYMASGKTQDDFIRAIDNPNECKPTLPPSLPPSASCPACQPRHSNTHITLLFPHLTRPSLPRSLRHREGDRGHCQGRGLSARTIFLLWPLQNHGGGRRRGREGGREGGKEESGR